MKRPALGTAAALALLVLALLLPALASAQPTSNIDPDQAFVWSETVGWIHFRPAHGGVIALGTHLEGFAWSENIGWIKLGATGGGPYANTNATNWGVNLAADGSLSGFGWSETAGWINFGSTHGQLAIDTTSKQFDGFAWARNFGFVHFSGPTGLYRLGLLLSLLEIPTLGEWGLILLMLLLGAAALRRMRKRRMPNARFSGRLTLLVVTSVVLWSPSLVAQVDSPAPPDDPASAMYTLENIYDRLATGANGVLRGTGFVEPTTGPTTTGRTLNEIMGVAPLADGGSGLGVAQCVAGRTFWSLLTASWGPRVCTAPNIGAQNVTPGTSAQSISLGFHDGSGAVAGDTDLLPANIASGVGIFGVTGSAVLASGVATDGQVLSGVTYSNAGGASTGTMPNIGAQNVTPGTAAIQILSGFHNGTGAVAGDGDLVPGNIRAGVDLFGVVGDPNVVNTSSGDAVAADLQGGKKAWVDGLEVTGTNGGCAGTLNGTRWCDNLNGTVTDLTTGLVWLKAADCAGGAPWFEPDIGSPVSAHTRASNLFDGSTDFASSDCSLTDGSDEGDWRLPTLSELEVLVTGVDQVRSGTPRAFTGIQTSLPYWSSTSFAGVPSRAWPMSLFSGLALEFLNDKTHAHFVWPVRSGQ